MLSVNKGNYMRLQKINAVSIKVGKDIYELFDTQPDLFDTTLEELERKSPLMYNTAPNIQKFDLEQILDKLYQETGIPYPAIHIHEDMCKKDDEYHLLLRDIPSEKARIVKGHVACLSEARDSLDNLDIIYTKTNNQHDLPEIWVNKKHVKILEKNNIQYWTRKKFIEEHVENFYRRKSTELID